MSTERQMTWDEVVAEMVVYRNERDAAVRELAALRAHPPRDPVAPTNKTEPGGVAVVVDPLNEYRDMADCPRGAKVILCTTFGPGTLGHYDGKDPQFIGWAPMPKIPARIKRLMKWSSQS